MPEFNIEFNLLISLTFFVWAFLLYMASVRGKRRRETEAAWRRDSISRWG